MDRASVGRHTWNSNGHRLQERLRHALQGIRRQCEYVERPQPWRHVLLIADKAHPGVEPQGADLRHERVALRTVAHDHEQRLALREERHRLEEIAVAFPVA